MKKKKSVKNLNNKTTEGYYQRVGKEFWKNRSAKFGLFVFVVICIIAFACPLRKDCSVVKQKKSYIFKVSETKLHRSQLIAKMGTSKYQELARKRAGIEGIPSILRRR